MISLLLSLYHSLFVSQLRYGLVIWGGGPTFNMQRVLLIQKRAIRVLSKLKRRSSCREAFVNLNLLTVPSMYILDVVRTAGEVSSRVTRHCDDYFIQPYRLNTSRCNPQQAGLYLYNHLPGNLKLLSNKNNFHSELRKFLVSGCFYSVEEFINRVS